MQPALNLINLFNNTINLYWQINSNKYLPIRETQDTVWTKGWLAIAKLKPLSLFISLNIIALESI